MRGLKTTLLLAGLLVACTNVALAQTTQPNIILITLDDHNDWTPFLDGHPQSFTPNMDRLAEDGTSFINAFCSSPVCAPSRTSFLTGKMPRYTKVANNEDYKQAVGSDKDFRNIFSPSSANAVMYTIPEWLKDSAGYYTVGVNKVFHGWYTNGHSNDFDDVTLDPCEKGLSWSDFIEFDVDADPVPTPLSGPYHDGVEGLEAGQLSDSQEDGMLDTKGTDASVDIINDYASNPAAYCDRPLFLSLGIYKPHVPLYIPEKYFLEDYNNDIYQLPYDKPYNDPPNAFPPNGVIMAPQPENPYSDYQGLSPVGQLIAIGYKRHLDFEYWPTTLSPTPVIDASLPKGERRKIATESRRALVTMSYLASIRYVDAQIGKVLDALEANPDMAANTVVIVTSDHGFSLGEKKHWLKNGLWDSDIRIPMIIFDPRRDAGVISRETVSLIDLFPTLCDFAEVDYPLFPDGSTYLDGTSILPLIDDPGIHRNKPAITSLRIPPQVEGAGCYPQFSVRTERFHFIRYRGIDPSLDCDDPTAELFNFDELYDIGRDREFDRNEWYNLAEDPDYLPIILWLESFLPQKSLDGTVQPIGAINNLELPCALTRDDTLMLSGTIFGTESPEHFTPKWKITGYPTIFESDTVYVPMSIISDSDWDTRKDVTAYYSLVDTNGNVVSVDMVAIPSGDDGVPDPGFNWSLDSSRIFIAPNAVATFSESWNFGDGTVREESNPAPHLYTRPGAFEVTHTIRYNKFSDQVCDIQFTDTVVVPTTAFTGQCITPNPPYEQEISPDKAWIRWQAVFGSANYNWRYRERDHIENTWTEFSGTALQDVLADLDEFTQYEMELQALCSGGLISDWSYPVFFTTEPCRPPVLLSYQTSGDSIKFSWNNRKEATLGTNLFVLQDSVEIAQAIVPEGTNKYVIPLPDAGYEYEFYIRSRCEQIGATDTYEGRDLATLVFSTMDLDSTARHSDVQQIENSVRIRPNPAKDFAFIQIEGTFEGEKQVQVVDVRGALVSSFALRQNQAVELKTTAMPAGTYFVIVDGMPEAGASLVVTH